MNAPIPCLACPLRPLPGFKQLPPEILASISAQKTGQLGLPAGAVILAEGEASDRLFTLLSGWAFRFMTLSDGRRQILNILLPGDLIGLQGELMAASTHGVETLTDVSLCVFARDSLWTFYRDHPSLALDVTWLAAHEERIVDEAVLSVGRRTALERIAALLVHIHKRATGAGLAREGSVPFPLTQIHVADALGLSPVHTNRVLQRLRRNGLVRLEGGRLAIGDLSALQRVARYWEQPTQQRPLL
ncbi:Crp/Fnr family transcriptional regulator [Plastoroseomonas hellenica]|uniref:Crp/Fnr family transcriptional regulator n=1 Tax=Plastoroseomonas hellenica TaxID=2687306 RepID=UPI001BA95370